MQDIDYCGQMQADFRGKSAAKSGLRGPVGARVGPGTNASRFSGEKRGERAGCAGRWERGRGQGQMQADFRGKSAAKSGLRGPVGARVGPGTNASRYSGEKRGEERAARAGGSEGGARDKCKPIFGGKARRRAGCAGRWERGRGVWNSIPSFTVEYLHIHW